MSQNITGRYFLVGCVRSGTTLLTALLASHSAVASFPETMFFRYLIGNAGSRYYELPAESVKESVRRLARSGRSRIGFASPSGRDRVDAFLTEIGRQDLMSLYRSNERSLRRNVEDCVRILDTLALEQSKTVWIEKSPDHLAYVDEIARFVKPTRFIHILRNGSENIASIYHAARKYPDTHWNKYWGTLDRCIAQWKHCGRMTVRYAGSPDHLIVYYEDLVADPAGVLSEICTFLDLEYEETMLSRYQDTAKGLILERSEWKNGVFDAIQGNNSKLEIFTDEEVSHLLNEVRDLSSDPILGPLCVLRKQEQKQNRLRTYWSSSD